MEALADVSWRIYPAVALIIAGTAMALPGMRREIGGLRAPFSERDKPLRMMTGFRMAIVGSAILLFGAAWAGGVTWLMWLALIIGVGELIESSMMISGMRMGEEGRAKQERRRQRAGG